MFELNAEGGWIVPAGTKIAAGTKIPAHSQLGNWCTLGNDCTLGDRCRLGNGCTLEGLIAKRWLTLANVDGSGRQILIVPDGKETKVRAGCFIGTADQFVQKAQAKGKHIYAAVIPAVVAALLTQ